MMMRPQYHQGQSPPQARVPQLPLLVLPPPPPPPPPRLRVQQAVVGLAVRPALDRPVLLSHDQSCEYH
jgi:hypothetical protein